VILFARRGALLVFLIATILSLGCGKKGPPLPPLVRVPEPLSELKIRRLGDEVYIGFTLPTANLDGTAPADLVRVDVYAMTTQPMLPPDRELELEEFQEESTLVGSIDVLPPVSPAELVAQNPQEPDEIDGIGVEVAQGLSVVISESLTPQTQIAVDPWEDEREEPDGDEEPEAPPVIVFMTPPSPGPLQREYTVVSVTSRGNEAEAPERIAVPLDVPLPVTPPAPQLAYSEAVIDIKWEEPQGLRESVQAPTGDEGGVVLVPVPPPAVVPNPLPLSPSVPDEPLLPSVTGESGEPVDLVGSSASLVELRADVVPALASPGLSADLAVDTGNLTFGYLPVAVSRPLPIWKGTHSLSQPTIPFRPPLESSPIIEWAVGPTLESSSIVEWPDASVFEVFEVVELLEEQLVLPDPLHPEPVPGLTYADNRVEFGVERCYGVRTLETVKGLEVRSDMSPVTCVMLVDTFPPDAPEALSAVASEGEVSLIWVPNEEADLAGYLVLRGFPQDETLQPLNISPVTENTYRDTTAEPGVVYSYAVRAVDLAIVPNLSALSNRVDESAR